MKSVKKSKPRIDLSPLIHRLLIAESAKRGIRPNALVEKLIEEAASTEAKHLVGMNLEEKIDPQIAESANIPLAESENIPLAEDAKLPFAQSPPSLEPLSAKEKVALEHLQAGKTYREIEALEKDKTGLTKAIVSGMAQKFKGMGIYKGGKRGPKKQKLK
jgi:hypothetical protein